MRIILIQKVERGPRDRLTKQIGFRCQMSHLESNLRFRNDTDVSGLVSDIFWLKFIN